MDNQNKSENNKLAVANNGLNINVSDRLKNKLRKRLEDRNEDLILDKLEQIQMHKTAIKKLTAEINQLTDVSYFEDKDALKNEDKETETTDEE